MSEKHLQFSSTIFLLPVLFLLVIWGVFWLDWSYFLELRRFGVFPRTMTGLRGIVCSPFIHGGLKHIYNNSVAIFVLLLMMQYFYKKQTWAVLIFGILFSGLGTWLIGRESYHIGASGLIYVLVSFMFFKGIQTRYFRLVSLSLVIVVLYGSMLWYIFPDVEDSISWEGHLSGFVTGFVLSLVLKAPEYVDEQIYKYDWQQPDYRPEDDPFMRCFDENGKFIIIPKEEPKVLSEELNSCRFRSSLPILYSYVETKKEEKMD